MQMYHLLLVLRSILVLTCPYGALSPFVWSGQPEVLLTTSLVEQVYLQSSVGMRFFASSTRAIVGVLAALSCAAAQSFPNAQSIQVNTTGKLSPDLAVTLVHVTIPYSAD